MLFNECFVAIIQKNKMILQTVNLKMDSKIIIQKRN